MPQRYLILVDRRGGAIDPLARRIEGLANLTLAFSLGSVALLTDTAESTLQLANGRGAVVGSVFRRDGLASRISDFDHPEDPGRSFDPLRILQDRFWGAYVSVILQGGAVSVTRDPSGLLPCLYRADADLIAFGSDAALLEEAGVLTPEIEWSDLARLLYANELPQKRMALSGLCDLHAGSGARVVGGELEIVRTWSPWPRASDEPPASMEELAGNLERTVEDCVGSWASDRKRIVVAVSGGLDSSIVASCLTRTGSPATSALTISTEDSRGDESIYAQALCDHMGLALTQSRYDEGVVDITRSASIHLPRPAGRAQILAYDAVVRREIARSSADAFFTGSGGDNVFFSTNSARPLVDRYLVHGLHRGLFETARDVSVLTGASLWTVLHFAQRVPRRMGPKFRWPGDERFFSDEVAHFQQGMPLHHAWLDGPSDGLPGKASHVAMILRAQHYLDNYDRRLPFAAIHPLMSQPIVEAALAIPSWFSVRGGRDRAVARRAFAGRFPKVIADRRFKGGPDAFATKILRSNLALARERLLDGALCAHGILDRAALDGALTEAGLSKGHDYVRLLLLLDTEAWLESWAR